MIHGNRNRTKLWMLILVTPFLCLFFGCGKVVRESWEPHIKTLVYTKGDGKPIEISLFDTTDTSQRVIAIDKGELLKIEEFTCKLLPTVQREHGYTAQFRNLSEVPMDALNLEMRVLAMIRKWPKSSKSKCYDTQNMLVTEWASVDSSEWKIRVTNHQWKNEEYWDWLKLQVQTRKKGEESVETKEYYSNYIGLVPSSEAERTAWNIDNSAFSIIQDSLSGRNPDKPCLNAQAEKK